MELAWVALSPSATMPLIGPRSCGRSHAATSITIGVIRAGHHALVRDAVDLSQHFAEAAAFGLRGQLVQRLITVGLLIIEDLGEAAEVREGWPVMLGLNGRR